MFEHHIGYEVVRIIVMIALKIESALSQLIYVLSDVILRSGQRVIVQLCIQYAF